MRHELRTLQGKRLTFKAVVERYGTKPAFRGDDVPTILLRNVTHDGTEVTDHLWFTAGAQMFGLKAGDVIQFDARVSGYIKGYRGARAERLGEWREEFDWRLSYPTKVFVLDREEASVNPPESQESLRGLGPETDRPKELARAVVEMAHRQGSSVTQLRR